MEASALPTLTPNGTVRSTVSSRRRSCATASNSFAASRLTDACAASDSASATCSSLHAVFCALYSSSVPTGQPATRSGVASTETIRGRDRSFDCGRRRSGRSAMSSM